MPTLCARVHPICSGEDRAMAATLEPEGSQVESRAKQQEGAEGGPAERNKSVPPRVLMTHSLPTTSAELSSLSPAASAPDLETLWFPLCPAWPL